MMEINRRRHSFREVKSAGRDVTKRILVVDDRNELLHLMRRVLEDEQYQVSILQDGKAAFASVKNRLPDLLILDLKLGDVSGQEILKQIKSDAATADVPVIVYTAAVLEAQEVTKLIENDRQHYHSVYVLQKPFELEVLLDRVEALLAMPER
jgi:DNA-binding response OmpR family regulator